MHKIIDWKALEARAKAMDNDSLEFAIRDCLEARDAARGFDTYAEGYYQDEASVYSAELRKRVKAEAVKAANAMLRRYRKSCRKVGFDGYCETKAVLDDWASVNLSSMSPYDREEVKAEALRRARI